MGAPPGSGAALRARLASSDLTGTLGILIPASVGEAPRQVVERRRQARLVGAEAADGQGPVQLDASSDLAAIRDLTDNERGGDGWSALEPERHSTQGQSRRRRTDSCHG